MQVRMDKKDLKGEIGRALRSTTCALKNKGATRCGRGGCGGCGGGFDCGFVGGSVVVLLVAV